MYTVAVDVTFEYAHRLNSYVGKCHALHGHSGLATVVVESASLTSPGFVVDFGDLKHLVKGWIDSHWDHSTLLHAGDSIFSPLVELLGIGNIYPMSGEPTAENMAKELFDMLFDIVGSFNQCCLVSVSIRETATSTATYMRGGSA